MSYRAIYAYAWDLADHGVEAVVDEVRALGIDTITLAGSYHAGKFLRPHGRSGKIYFPEDGTIYFHPNIAGYGAIKPVPNSLLQQRCIFRELGGVSHIAVNAWMVLLHNTRLGTLYPQATVRNCFGDRFVYSLCPSAPEVREYAVALCKDITDNYPVAGVSIETPGFLPYVHGFHHEFALVKPNGWLEGMLGLCFCEHCVAGAEVARIDAQRLKARIAEEIETYLESDLDLPGDMADSFWLADIAVAPDISAFLRWRCDVVTSLVSEIRAAVRPDANVAVIPSVARPTGGSWYEGSDLRSLAGAAGIIEACFYEANAARIRADVWDVQRRTRGAGRLRGILRPGYPDLQSRSEVVAAAEVLRDAGITDIAFYNFGHLRRKNLTWVADAIAVLEG